MKYKFYETKTRSSTKALTFRAIVIVSDIVIIYLLTHTYTVVLSIVIFTNLASMLLYLLHERIWNKINWGRVKKS